MGDGLFGVERDREERAAQNAEEDLEIRLLLVEDEEREVVLQPTPPFLMTFL